MKLLITGVCGFVGSTLARSFVADGTFDEIIGIDNFSRSGSELNRRPLQELGVRVLHGDIRSASDVEAVPKVDWVIDAAANPSVLAGVDGKTSSRQLVEHNLSGTINILEFCKRHQAGFILLSTSRVYSIPGLAQLRMNVVNDAFHPDPDQEFPPGITVNGVNEQYSTSPPVSLYGSTKVASEHLALEYGETFQFPVWVNRCGVMAGAGQFGHPAQGIFAYWIHCFRERRPLKYIGFGGHGHQVRDCLHPRDMMPLLKRQCSEPLHSEKQRILHVSGGTNSAMSLSQLSEWCRRRLGSTYITQSADLRPYDIPWIIMDPTLAQDVWGWSAQIPTDVILEEIASFAETHDDWLSICQ